ncbi:hypothetical protein H6P81_011180 [Aristolochia fimbriata]|uniref:WRKY19-like zinc finger domain-containing protein n=1 Tax=Aristolochia fimbriata TaxID=158543 RepID=A0AAV7EQU5_ARIFI|nr:hypothetical protein H6P81_011180 [Aristolochia fimbriata]
MDFNLTGFSFPGKEQFFNPSAEIGFTMNYGRSENLGDTSLSLTCLARDGRNHGQFKQTQDTCEIHATQMPDDSCRLVLGLGPSLSSYRADSYTIGAHKNKESQPTICSQQLTSDNDSVLLKLGLSGGTENMMCRNDNITTTESESVPSFLTNQCSFSESQVPIPVVDEGSTSARRVAGGYMPSLLLAPRQETSGQQLPGSISLCHHLQVSPEPSGISDCSVDMISDSATPRPASENRGSHPKKCRFNGCSKGARGASGLCIAHGGGQRCQKPGCNKGAESRTAYCKAHGGGRRCHRLGCTKSAEGKTDFCIAHGGGRRCGHQGCNKAARGKSGLCIRHGGGKRCTVEGCTRSAEGQAGLCISHGGGRRCQHSGCSKGAQGSTLFCKAHGGGKRCIFVGCTKGAEGSTPLCKGHGGGKRCLFDGGGICPKSVHGGTDYCVAHGGGKRCAVPGCTKSARGRTDCCVRHGGGKRCKFENCGKSAQGSTDFCKAHGGGKRCSWDQGTCEKFARGKSGFCAAHGSLAREKEKLGRANLIGPGLFRSVVSVSTAGSSVDLDHSSGMSGVSECVESENIGSRQLIPPQVLVPLSMKSSSSISKEGGIRGSFGGTQNLNNFVVPEGRVHGGGLMSFLGGNLKNAADR